MRAFLLSVTLFLLVSNTSAQTYVELYNSGKEKLLKGDAEDAVADLSEAIFLKPDYWEAYRMRARAHYYLDNYYTAIEDYSRALELHPNDFELYIRRGDCYYYTRNYILAVPDFKRSIALYKAEATPSDTVIPKGYHSYAKLFMEVAEEDSAFVRTPELLHMLFTPVDVYDANLSTPVNITSLPDSSIRRLMFDSAEVYLIMAMQLEPEQRAHRLMLGNLLYQRGYDLDGAIENYHKAIEYSPVKYYDAHFNLGIIYNEKNMYDLARDNLLIAADLRKDNAQPKYLLAEIYAKLNKPALVEYWLNDASFIRAPEAHDYYQIGTGFGKAGGNLEMAIVYLKKAIELAPTVELYYEDLGVAYGLSQRYDDAIATAKKLIQLNPDYAAAYQNLAFSYGYKGNKKLEKKYLKMYEELKKK